MARNPIVVAAAAIVIFLVASGVAISAIQSQRSRPATGPGSAAGTCRLANGIQHVIFLQFDNVHLTRDFPGVPSDLEQMPHLYDVLKANGAVLSNDHTPLIAHTATDIVTTETGVYPDRHGLAVSNSYRYYNSDGSTGGAASFAYWTGRIPDNNYNVLAKNGLNAPAPWVPFTRAGCNVGAAGAANIVIENTADIQGIFGSGSAESAESAEQAGADLVGVSVHCAVRSPICAATNGGRADLLVDEPGGYHGYRGLFGHKYVGPQISPGAPFRDLAGQPLPGFPGFGGMKPDQSLAYVAAMQEHGIPITYAYIENAHGTKGGTAPGPGSAEMVKSLKAYDDGFGRFFERIKSDGFTPANTLLVVSSDENDHFAGSKPAPAGCDGVVVPCTYSKIGEVAGDLTGMLAALGVATPFGIHADTAPAIWVNGNPAPGAPEVRAMERAAAMLTANSPLTGADEQVTTYLADRVEMRALHMTTADPNRNPTFTLFANPDYYLSSGPAACPGSCVKLDPANAYNHGDLSPDINTTWVAFSGPGVKRAGIDAGLWADHADIRPTMMAVLGLKDDYMTDGRVLLEDLEPNALAVSLRSGQADFANLGAAYKTINAPVGPFAMSTLAAATRAIASGAGGDDSAYTKYTADLTALLNDRDALAARMAAALNDAAFNGRPIDSGQAQAMEADAQRLLVRAGALGS